MLTHFEQVISLPGIPAIFVIDIIFRYAYLNICINSLLLHEINHKTKNEKTI